MTNKHENKEEVVVVGDGYERQGEGVGEQISWQDIRNSEDPSKGISFESIMNDWCMIIQAFYHNLLQQTYCVPPVYFNRVPYTRGSLAGQSFLLKHRAPHSISELQYGPVMPLCLLRSSSSKKKKKAAKAGKAALSRCHSLPVSSNSTAEIGGTLNADGTPAYSEESSSEFSYSMWTRETGQTAQSPVDIIFESDTREDVAQQQVLYCLQTLGEEQKEVMFIVSQMNFTSVLNKPCYAAAVKSLPKSLDLPVDYKRGDCDILLIHRHYGILVGEVKSVGLKADVLKKSQAEADADISKRVKKAVKQLIKSEFVLKYIVKDIVPELTVKKTLILPYVSNKQLLRIMQGDAALEKMVCESIGATDSEAAAQLCVCSEQLSHPESPWDVTHEVLSELSTWFHLRMGTSADACMSDNVYTEIVARVAGPASSVTVHCVFSPRVEVRTLDQAISQTGERLAQLVLTPAQLNLVQKEKETPILCLTGPPGTGKTLLLVIVGLIWLRQGHDVHVVSVRSVNLAVSRLIRHQLQMTIRSDSNVPLKVGKVYLHEFHVDEREEDVEKVVAALLKARDTSEEKSLHVLMDEILLGDSLLPSALGKRVYCIIKNLMDHIQELHLWAATMYRVTICDDLPVEQLTEPLRCSPVVLREVLPGVQSSWYSEKVYEYTNSGTPTPCDGPKVIRLCHQGEGHTGQWPVDCIQCGLDVGNLLHDLKVDTEAGPNAVWCAHSKNCDTCASTTPPSLQYRDVFVLTRSSELCDGSNDTETDDSTNTSSCASGFVRGMRKLGIPVCVIGRKDTKEEWERKVGEMGVALENQVTITHFSAVIGMERKVVVHLPGRKYVEPEEQTLSQIESANRILAMSRCTGQLIVVDVPSSNDANEQR